MANIRLLKEMEKVVWDKDFARNHPKKELYQVYRNQKTDGELRYDVTVIKPNMLGGEFVRTKGNMNSDGFQELYTVLEGKAIFLIQKFEDEKAADVRVLKAESGDWVIIPPYCWVVTINPSKEKVLETGNWVSEKTENQYRRLEKMGGQAWFYTEEGWLKNKNYEEVPGLKFEKPLPERPERLGFLREGMGE